MAFSLVSRYGQRAPRTQSSRRTPRAVWVAGLSVVLAGMSACSGLSEREEKMVGKYYIPQLSDTSPIIELNGDRSSTLRAIMPGELTYSVDGRWEVAGDSLIIVNNAESITIEDGDPSLVGRVAPRVAWPIKRFDESTLSIERQGITYDYRRRME